MVSISSRVFSIPSNLKVGLFLSSSITGFGFPVFDNRKYAPILAKRLFNFVRVATAEKHVIIRKIAERF